MRRLGPCFAPLLLLSASFLITGCSLESTAAPGVQAGVAIAGNVHGGRQAVIGARVYLLAATTTGNGGSGIAPSPSNASVSLLKVANTGLSDALGAYVLSAGVGGNFSITGDYTCPSDSTQVYIYAVGGNSGAGENPAAGFLSALGPCGNLGAGTYVTVNEISTVASAYAMAGFTTDATHVGSSATTLAQKGVANGFATFTNLMNPITGVALTKTPAGNGTVPQSEINSLANSLAACVNTSIAGGATQCVTLFKNATNDGITCTTPPCADEPTDTAGAAINIAHFPSKNVAAIFNIASGIGAPFQTPLSSAPPDWTLALSFTATGLTPGASQSQGIAIDASGNLWVVPVYADAAPTDPATPGSKLFEFNPLGVSATAGGITTLGLNYPNGLAIDADSTHIWIANFGNDNVVSYTISSGAHAAFSAGGSGVGPVTVAIDSAGFPWVANTSSTPWVVKLNPSTGAVVTTLSNNGLSEPTGVAFAPGSLGNVWVANGSGSNFSLFTNAGAAVTNKLVGQQLGLVVDGSGSAWFNVLYNGFEKVNSAGTTNAYFGLTGEGVNGTQSSSAVDGAGNIWGTNNDFNTHTASDNNVFELNNAGGNISGTNGYVPAPTTSQPNSLAIDGSGNVWYTSQTDGLLRELVGAAAPVATPLSYATANSKLGARP